jgi:protein O-mannosyl-transferase
MTRAVREGFVLAAVPVALAGLVYLNVLGNPFVYDDFVTVVGNRALVERWGPAETLRFATFRPTTAFSYALDHAVWGLNPFGYHLTNVLLHMINVALVFQLGLLLGEDRNRLARVPPAPAGAVAFVLAALFAVHPALSGAVSYVSARSEIVAGTLFLASFLCLRIALVKGQVRWGIPGLVLYLLVLGAREVASALPFVLLVYDLLVLGGSRDERRRRALYCHVPLIGATVAAGVLRITVFATHEGGALHAIERYALTEARVLWRYVQLLVAPIGLSIVHDVAPGRWDDVRTWGALAGLVAVVALAVAIARRLPFVSFGIAWFLLLLAPTSVIPLRDEMAEHRMYLASVGFFFALVALAARAFPRLLAMPRNRQTMIAGAFVVVLTVLGALTMTRNTVWADSLTLWREAAERAPHSWIARFGYANALAETGNCRDALPEFGAALRLASKPEIATNLATCLVAERRRDEALRTYRRALEIDPYYVPAHFDIALLLFSRGERAEAHHHFMLAVAPDWRRPKWREEMVEYHEKMFDDPAKTLELCRELLRVASETPGVRECIARNEARLTRAPKS